VQIRIVAAVLIGSQISFSCPGRADVPVHYYCGGMIQYISGRWWLSGTSENVPLTLLDSAPSSCPTSSSQLTHAGGLGDQTSIPNVAPIGGALNASGGYFSYTPQANYGPFAVLTAMLATYFSGPQFSASSSMTSDLSQLRQLSAGMTSKLQADASYIQSQEPPIAQRAAVDVTALSGEVKGSESSYDASTAALQTTLNSRSTAGATTDSALGAIVSLLSTQSNVSEIQSELPPEHLRPSGDSMFGTLDSVRASQFAGLTEPEAQALREHLKVEKDVANSVGGASGNVGLKGAQTALLALQRFSQDSPGSGAVVSALLSQATADRYFAEGYLPYLTVATFQDGGSIGTARLPPGSSLPTNAVVEEAADFDVLQSSIAAKLASLNGQSAQGSIVFASGLLDDARVSFYDGYSDGGLFELSAASRIIGEANGSIQAQPDTSSEDKSELSHLDDVMFGGATNASVDAAVDQMSEAYLGIYNLGAATSLLRDFAEPNVLLASYVNAPSDEKASQVAVAMIRFNFSAVGGSLATALTVFLAETFTLGVATPAIILAGVAANTAAAVGADYAARALMLKGSQAVPPEQDKK